MINSRTTIRQAIRAIAIVLLFAGNRSLARDIYVSNVDGDDTLCGSLAEATGNDGPVRTIAKALRLAIPSDRIVLANTGFPYREMFAVQGEKHSGQFRMPFVIEGNGAVLDGSAPVPPDEWKFVREDIFRFDPPLKAHGQLFIEDRPVARKAPIGEEELLPELEPLEWCLARGSMYLRVERGQLPQNYAMSYAAMPVGITIYKSHDIVIHDLVVQGFQLDGINAHDGVRNAKLLEVTSRGNGRSGVCVAGASRVELSSSTLLANGVAQLWCEGYSRTHVYNSQLMPESAPEIARLGGELWIDGQFKDK